MKTQKTYMIIAVVGAVVIFLFAILYFATYEETDILNVSADEIKSIYVTNGSNGDMVDVPSSVFPDFAKALNEVKLKRENSRMPLFFIFQVSLTQVVQLHS